MSSQPGIPASTASMTLRGAVFLGVGAMVGAGIFALLGEAGAIAGSAVWLSFLIGGLLTLALGYSMAKMGARYPLAGGTISYLLRGFGHGRIVGTASWLGYLTSVVVVSAMVASSFGSYLAVVVFGEDAPRGWVQLFGSLLVALAVALCIVGPRLVDRAQSFIVIALVLVFVVFIIATLPAADMSMLAPSSYPPLPSIISGAAVTFFAYLGFGVISFSAGDLINPKRNLPRATYTALVLTAVLYVLIAISVFGTLTVPQVVEYGPTAIAEAARPVLGEAGFDIMAVAALLATASSVTATLYASQGMTGALAEAGAFPIVFRRDFSWGRHTGLLITAAIVLAFVIVFDVGVLASIGSGVSLAVFMLVGIAAFRLRHEIGARTSLVLASIIGAGVVLAVFMVDLYQHDRTALGAMFALAIASAGIDAVRRRGRREI